MNQTNQVRAMRSNTQLSSDAPTVFVIDDDKSVRESLESLITDAGWQPISFDSAKAFLGYRRLIAPSCLVSEMWPPDLDGLRLQGLLVDRSELPIIFMTERADISVTVRAMKAGAVEFLTKPIVKEVLLNALREALERSAEALRQEAEMKALREGYASLSCRERQVMALVVHGMMNKRIGAQLGISEITVKAHRGNAARKMGARSLAELVTMAAALGLVSLVRSPPRPHIAAARPAIRPSSGSERFYPNRLLADVAYPLVAGMGAFASG